MISKTGRVVVRVEALMDTHARRDDGSESILLADTRFDNHAKMTITGIVQVGTDSPDVNPVEDADRNMPRCRHYPVGYIGGDVFPVDIRKGDQVWFHYLCAEDRTSMERNRDGTWDVYMQVSDIFCMQRKGEMIMNQNWCLGREITEDFSARLTPSNGIQIVKGFNIQSYVDEAIVQQIDFSAHRNMKGEVSKGDRVYLAKDAGFPNVIKGVKKLLFRQTDIIARWNVYLPKIKPVGDYHLVKVRLNEYRAAKVLHKIIIRPPVSGEVLTSGSHCVNAGPGDKVLFTVRWARLLHREYYLVSDGEIQAHIA